MKELTVTERGRGTPAVLGGGAAAGLALPNRGMTRASRRTGLVSPCLRAAELLRAFGAGPALCVLPRLLPDINTRVTAAGRGATVSSAIAVTKIHSTAATVSSR